MQLSGVRLIIASFLVASACAAATDEGSIPGGLLAVAIPYTLLKPLLNSNNAIKSEERRGGVLRGLLQVRQSSCRIGWAACSSGGCCPIGGQCCSNDKCCDTGSHCCQGGGCCEFGDNCVQVVSTGQRGCCPIGKTCVGGGGGGGDGGNSCVTPSYSPCPNDNFCCPPGNTCYRDSSGERRCRLPGSPPVSSPPVSSPPVSSPPVSIPTTTLPATTFQTTSTSLFNTATGTGTATGLSPTVYATPFPFSGTSNVVVYATDTRIIWAGSSWTLGPSSCNSTAQSKKTSSLGHSLTFTITSAKSVFLALSARNVEYDISINGRTTTFTKTTTLDDCKLTWSSGAITTPTTMITITVRGPSAPVFNGRRQLASDWSFEFHNFLTSMSDSAATGGSTDPPGFPGAGNAAMGLEAHSLLYTALVAPFVVFFGFF